MSNLASFQQAVARALLAPPGTPAPATISVLTAQPGFAVLPQHRDERTDRRAAGQLPDGDAAHRRRLVSRRCCSVRARAPAPPIRRCCTTALRSRHFWQPSNPRANCPTCPAWRGSIACGPRRITRATNHCSTPPRWPRWRRSSLPAPCCYPHAAARWAWFADAPIFSIWARNREAPADDGEMWEPSWLAEGALLTRPAWSGAVAGARRRGLRVRRRLRQRRHSGAGRLRLHRPPTVLPICNNSWHDCSMLVHSAVSA